jgi:hypothetical protein
MFKPLLRDQQPRWNLIVKAAGDNVAFNPLFVLSAKNHAILLLPATASLA